MLLRLVIVVVGLCVSGLVSAQTVGEILSQRVPVRDAQNQSVYAYVPLPPGEWEVADSSLRQSIGNTSADLRSVRLLQIEKGFLKHAIEITMKVNGVNMQWNDEPCKVEPTLAKNDFGTALFKQKCLTLRADTFLQNNNRVTNEALEALAKRAVKNDFNSLVLTYSRYGDFGYFLIVRQHFFPSVYGQENPKVVVVNESPWHPSRVNQSSDRKALVEAIFRYGEGVAKGYDEAYMRKEVEPLPAFDGH